MKKLLLLLLAPILFTACEKESTILQSENTTASGKPTHEEMLNLERPGEAGIPAKTMEAYAAAGVNYGFDFGGSGYAYQTLEFADLLLSSNGYMYYIAPTATTPFTTIFNYGSPVTVTLPKPASYASVLGYDEPNYNPSAYHCKIEGVSGGAVAASAQTRDAAGYTLLEVTAPEGKTFDKLVISNPYGGFLYFGSLTVVYNTAVEVEFDVMPGKINLKSRGVVPSAVFSTPDFDASAIDISTLAVNGQPVSEAHGKQHLEDVNEDGLADLVLHFNAQDLPLTPGEIELTLTGSTSGGADFTGTDVVFVK